MRKVRVGKALREMKADAPGKLRKVVAIRVAPSVDTRVGGSAAFKKGTKGPCGDFLSEPGFMLVNWHICLDHWL